MSKTTMILLVAVVAFLLLAGGPTLTNAGRAYRPDPFGQPPPAPNYGNAPPPSANVGSVVQTLLNVGGAAYRDYLDHAYNGGQDEGIDSDFVDSLPYS
jgi:hypothetical protein